MADRFSRAMMEQVTGRPLSVARGRQSELDEAVSGPVQRDPDLEADLEAVRNGQQDPTPSPIPDAEDEWETNGPSTESSVSPDPNTASEATSEDVGETSDVSEKTKEAGLVDNIVETETENDTQESDRAETGKIDRSSGSETITHDSNSVETTNSGDNRLVSRLRSEIDELGDRATEMLRQYRGYGPATPQEIHTAAGGSGDRGPAYATNRTLRQRGFITHVGCGQYDYALSTLVREELADPLRPEDLPSADTVADLVSAVETALLEEVTTADGTSTVVAHSEKPTPKTATEQ
jgi:hypothetical protein